MAPMFPPDSGGLTGARPDRRALRRKKRYGAGGGNRTRDIQLGKLTFYL